MNRSLRLCLGVLALAGATAEAQNYPVRSINLIVPFAAGGPSDALARLLAQAMVATLGQQVGVENVTGAGGTLDAGKAAQSRPDGYTVLLAHIGQAASVTLYRKLPYDPVGAFDTIGLIAEVPMTIVGRKDLPPKDIVELIAHVKANKDKITYGNGGVGSAWRGLALVRSLAGTRWEVSLPLLALASSLLVSMRGRAPRVWESSAGWD